MMIIIEPGETRLKYAPEATERWVMMCIGTVALGPILN